jgi:hypothetical protein
MEQPDSSILSLMASHLPVPFRPRMFQQSIFHTRLSITRPKEKRQGCRNQFYSKAKAQEHSFHKHKKVYQKNRKPHCSFCKEVR